MPWPNFVVIGAAKSGTSSLYKYLGQHPDVYVSPQKEPRFLAPPTESRHRLTEPHDWETDEKAYLRLFDGVEGEHAVGEASPGYLYKEGTPGRMHHYVPEAKLIAILRQPVKRAYSNYISLYGRGAEPLADFEEALKAEEEEERARRLAAALVLPAQRAVCAAAYTLPGRVPVGATPRVPA